MKKILSMLLVLSMLLGASAALADGMGVQVIGGPAAETEPVSLDDFKLDIDVEIEGYGIFCGTSFYTTDHIGYYRSGRSEVYDAGSDYNWAGAEADYMILKMDITNVAMTAKNFLDNVTVKAVYDDVYEYGGWAHQYNWNNKTYSYSSYEEDRGKQNKNWYINKADNFAINPMYKGHYCFGVTLPNAVINSKKPLRMIITIDGNEITYNIRK